MNSIIQKRERPHFVDVLRAIGYGHLGVWAILFVFFPSIQVAEFTEDYTRVIWLGMAGLGAFVAMLGALTGLDVKVELPGILFTAIGPAFYSVINLYFVVFPTTGPGSQAPMTRLSLSFLFIAVAILLLPRAIELYSEGLRTRSLRRVGAREMKDRD